MYLVGFTMWIYHDARSPERQSLSSNYKLQLQITEYAETSLTSTVKHSDFFLFFTFLQIVLNSYVFIVPILGIIFNVIY